MTLFWRCFGGRRERRRDGDVAIAWHGMAWLAWSSDDRFSDCELRVLEATWQITTRSVLVSMELILSRENH